MVSPSLASIRGLIIDADGVLWHGARALPGVREFFQFLKDREIRFISATNNSARPANQVVERLAAMQVELSRDQVLTSAQATALYLQQIAGAGERVMVIGGDGLKDAVAQAGFELVDDDAQIVVAGVDWDLTYDKLKRATLAIRRGARFIGTNADKTYPGAEGIIPGAGAILAALQAATDVAPIVVGKPERAMFDIAMQKMNTTAASTAMLGDRLDTDIDGARRAGLKTILVLTGVTTADQLSQLAPQPDWTCDDLDALRAEWVRAY
ncbi:MAG: HAD-IIA family hydrolase [Chloroflexi bacterium]|nr:HAD-IIA family hydrolase [Chloroflexota bacterium]